MGGWVSILCVCGVCMCVCVCVFSPEWLWCQRCRSSQLEEGQRTVVGTEFINVSNDDIEEVWRDHVATLLKGKSEAVAVNTMFLLNRLFLVSDPHAVLLSFS